MARSRIGAWLSGNDDRWRSGAPQTARPGPYNVTMGNVRALRIEGPDPQGSPGDSRWYTLVGPFPGDPWELEDWIDEWIGENYGEFL